jgi:hypothetical protein
MKKTAFGLFALLVFAFLGFQNCGAPLSSNSSFNQSSLSTSLIPCTGIFTITSGGATGTLGITSQDSSGNISGYMDVNGVNGTLTGTCSSSTGSSAVNFTRTYPNQYQIFTGIVTQVTSSLTNIQMSGTYVTCSSSGSCGSTPNTWSAVIQ